jgi:hypothetical protein
VSDNISDAGRLQGATFPKGENGKPIREDCEEKLSDRGQSDGVAYENCCSDLSPCISWVSSIVCIDSAINLGSDVEDAFLADRRNVILGDKQSHMQMGLYMYWVVCSIPIGW